MHLIPIRKVSQNSSVELHNFKTVLTVFTIMVSVILCRKKD